MQTCLEKKGIESRNDLIVRNDYAINDQYSAMHPDALATGDPQGKGTGHGGHTHSIPDCNAPSSINYSNFDTNGGGGQYDIDGRNGVGGRVFCQNISMYNETNDYCGVSIDTSANVADGQIVIL
jgi:hypothetical protein